MDCSVCCETFKHGSPKMITCNNKDCNFNACRSCNQTYLESKEAMEPHCMNCKTAWTKYFVVTKLTRTWFNSTYTPIRNKVIVDTEVSRLPESMPRATALKREMKHQKEHQELIQSYHQTLKLLSEAQDQGKKDEFSVQLDIIRNKLAIAAANLIVSSRHDSPDEEKKLVMACVFEDCKGFLNQDYLCELCNRSTCKDCLCGIEGNHECNKEAKETADEIKKSTRPCPTCGERIFKINGCDQMYCTQCYTAFSWNTGNVETGNIHNPHFFQLRRENNGILPRNPNDILCGGIPDVNRFNRDMYNTSTSMIRHYQNPKNYEVKTSNWRDEICLKTCTAIVLHKIQISSIHHLIESLTVVDLRRHRERSRELASCHDIRVDYLTDKIDKATFDAKVVKRTQLKQKTDEFLHLYELVSIVGIEFIRDIFESTFEITEVSHNILCKYFAMMKQKLLSFYNLLSYINHQFKILSVAHNCEVLQIRIPLWSLTLGMGKENRIEENFRYTKHHLPPNSSILVPIDWSDTVEANTILLHNASNYEYIHRFHFGRRFKFKATMKELEASSETVEA